MIGAGTVGVLLAVALLTGIVVGAWWASREDWD